MAWHSTVRFEGAGRYIQYEVRAETPLHACVLPMRDAYGSMLRGRERFGELPPFREMEFYLNDQLLENPDMHQKIGEMERLLVRVKAK